MIHATRKSTNRKRRLPVRIEQLESRLLCAAVPEAEVPLQAAPALLGTVDAASFWAPAPFLTAIATTPASGATLHAPPQTLTVRFDRAVDPTTASFDFELYQVGADGSLTSVVDNGPAYTEEFDSSATEILVMLGQALPAGHYELAFSPISSLMGADGSMLAPDALATPLSDFTVTTAGALLSEATNLGTLAPASGPIAVAGALDLAADPSAVRLYQLTLPATQAAWRLGLEVTAARDGSGLDPALALFESQGKPIATDDVGRADFPGDPFLFHTLAPGTYYVGVSGMNNLPGLPGGYDLLAGTDGTVAQMQAGGAFTLHAQVDAQPAPISLLSFRVDHADSLSAQPTGLTLQFSGALGMQAVPSGSMGTSLGQAIQVVDQRGKVWPVLASVYDENNAAVSFVFANPLPAGQYTVRLARVGGLTDLTGEAPVAAGLPSGVLGQFKVEAVAADSDPADLGALLPGRASAGVSRFALLDPGESATYRFVITYPGYYAFQVQYAGAQLTADLTGPGLSGVPLAALGRNALNENLMAAVPGVYVLHVAATGAQPVLAHLKLVLPQTSPDSLLANGVGQGPALNLTLIAPTALGEAPPAPLDAPAGLADSTLAAPFLAPAATTPVAPLAPATLGLAGGTPIMAAVLTSVTIAAPPAPSAAGRAAVPIDPRLPNLVAIVSAGDFVGRPAPAGNRVAAVGPGEAALALGPQGTLPGSLVTGSPLGAAIKRKALARAGEPAHRDRHEAADPASAATNGAMFADEGLEDYLASLPASGNPTSAEVTNAAVGQVLGVVSASLGELPTEGSPGSGRGPGMTAFLRDPGADGREAMRPDSAGLTSPLAFGLIVAVVTHYRRQLANWFELRRAAERSRQTRRRSFYTAARIATPAPRRLPVRA